MTEAAPHRASEGMRRSRRGVSPRLVVGVLALLHPIERGVIAHHGADASELIATISVSTGSTFGLRWKEIPAADPAGARFVLDAELHEFSCDRPLSGDRTAEAGVRYVLTERSSGRKFFREVKTRDEEKNLDRPDWPKEFVTGVLFGPDILRSSRRIQATFKREQTAIGNAISGNITDFIEGLAAFPEGYGTPLAATAK